jgi:hypothetical protein
MISVREDDMSNCEEFRRKNNFETSNLFGFVSVTSDSCFTSALCCSCSVDHGEGQKKLREKKEWLPRKRSRPKICISASSKKTTMSSALTQEKKEQLYAEFVHLPPVVAYPMRKRLEEYSLEELIKLEPESASSPSFHNQIVCGTCHHFKNGPEYQVNKRLPHRCPKDREKGCPAFHLCPTRRRDLHKEEVDQAPQTENKIQQRRKHLVKQNQSKNKEQRAERSQMLTPQLTEDLKRIIRDSEDQDGFLVQQRMALVTRAAILAAKENVPYEVSKEQQERKHQKLEMKKTNDLAQHWFGKDLSNIQPETNTDVLIVKALSTNESVKIFAETAAEEAIQQSDAGKTVSEPTLEEEEVALRKLEQRVRLRKRERYLEQMGPIFDAHAREQNQCKRTRLGSFRDMSRTSSDLSDLVKVSQTPFVKAILPYRQNFKP